MESNRDNVRKKIYLKIKINRFISLGTYHLNSVGILTRFYKTIIIFNLNCAQYDNYVLIIYHSKILKSFFRHVIVFI